MQFSLQFFDIAGWDRKGIQTVETFGVALETLKVLLWDSFLRPGFTRTDLQNNKTVKQKLKVVVVVVVIAAAAATTALAVAL